MTDARWVTVRQAAEYAGVSEPRLRRMIRSGTLPACRPAPRTVRVCLDDVDRVAPAAAIPSPRVEQLAARIRRFRAAHGDELPELTDEQCRVLARLLPSRRESGVRS